jgi:hypothetical protein
MGEQREVITADPYIVGKPPARPDGKPGFAAWTEKPSDLSRPDPATCSAPDTHDHAHGLIRVLSDADDAAQLAGRPAWPGASRNLVWGPSAGIMGSLGHPQVPELSQSLPRNQGHSQVAL